MIHDGFGFFNCGSEKLLHLALNGPKKPRWQSDEDFLKLNVTPVYSWPIYASEHVYDP